MMVSASDSMAGKSVEDEAAVFDAIGQIDLGSASVSSNDMCECRV